MSSLPKAPKDVSSHPVKGSVSAPLDKKAKDADVERKMRLFGAIDALRHHKLPSNGQIDDAMRYVLDASPSSLDNLSSEGKRLIQDVKDVVATLRFMILEKNADEMIQDLTWKLSSSGNPLKDDSLGAEGAVGKGVNQTHEDRDQAVKHLRTLLTLVVTNSEVRKLLGDFSIVGRDLLARGAGKAANAIAPSASALEGVDQPAPDNEFMTEGGRTVGSDETPVLEANVPGVGGVKADPHSGSAQAFRDGGEDGQRQPIGEVGGLTDAKNKARNLKGSVKGGARDKMGSLKGEGMQQAREAQQATEAGDEGAINEKKGGMMGKMKQFRDNMRDGVSDALPHQSGDAVNERMERSKTFFNDEYFPKERRDQFIFRGKKVLLECQNHDDYQGAMRWLISFVEGYIQQGLDATGSGKGAAMNMDPTLKFCMSELRTLLERFANGISMSVITDAIDALVDDSRRDPALRSWFTDASEYAKKVLLEPGYILDDQCNARGYKIRQSGKRFYDEKYKDHFNYLFESVGNWFGGMSEDPINRQFGLDWARLAKDLLFDSEGSLKFKPELWNDIRKVILPTLIDQVGYIPIPRVEYTDENLDLVIENLTLQGRNIFPNIVALETNNFMKFSPYSSIQDVARHHVTVSLQQIQADMRDVAFFYRKKTGLPKMKDSGIADVLLGGTGLSATVELVSSSNDPSSVFKVHHVNVKVDSLKFAIRDSSHDFLYKTLRPLATGLIKKQIEKVVGDGLRTFFEYMDGSLVSVRDKMGQGKNAENKGEVLKQIFSRKKQEKQELPSSTSFKTGTSASHSQFKIVSDKRDSILAGEGHPSGWINRTSEMQDIARGDVGGQPASGGGFLAATGLPPSGSTSAAHGGTAQGQGSTMGRGQTSMERQQWKSEAFTMESDDVIAHPHPGHSQPRNAHKKQAQQSKSRVERVVDSSAAHQRVSKLHN